MIRNCCGIESICCDNGAKGRIYYYLLCQQFNGFESYGIEVVLRCDGRRESAELRHITTSPLRILDIVSKLQRNLVTPCTLYDVITDELER